MLRRGISPRLISFVGWRRTHSSIVVFRTLTTKRPEDLTSKDEESHLPHLEVARNLLSQAAQKIIETAKSTIIEKKETDENNTTRKIIENIKSSTAEENEKKEKEITQRVLDNIKSNAEEKKDTENTIMKVLETFKSTFTDVKGEQAEKGEKGEKDGKEDKPAEGSSYVSKVIWDQIKQTLVPPNLDIDIRKVYDLAIPFIGKSADQDKADEEEKKREEIYQTMLDRDTIHDLVYFTTSTNTDIRLEAIKNLCVLSINEKLREDIFVIANVMLVSLCNDSHPQIQTYALTTLGNVALKESVRKLLWERNGPETFIKLAKDEKQDIGLRRKSRRLLAILGENDFFLTWKPKTRGLRILTIDGGGTRGIATIELLKRLEEITGKRLYELFDFVGGTSTGAQICAVMSARQLPLDEIERLYIEQCTSIFTSSRSSAAPAATAAAVAAADATSAASSITTAISSQWSKLSLYSNVLTSGAFYKAKNIEDVLMKFFEDRILIDTSEDYNTKFFALSTLVNTLPSQPYIFRNYQYPINSASRYPGSCTAHIWQALRASTAAPSYFDEFTMGNDRLQDGGIIANNPTAIAYHEARKIWGPDVKIDCVVSLGTGRSFPKPTKNSLKDTLVTLVDSATSTERVHEVMEDVIPEGRYFRFNPMDEAFDVDLDETRIEKLEAMQAAARKFTTENDEAFRKACEFLVGKKL